MSSANKLDALIRDLEDRVYNDEDINNIIKSYEECEKYLNQLRDLIKKMKSLKSYRIQFNIPMLDISKKLDNLEDLCDNGEPSKCIECSKKIKEKILETISDAIKDKISKSICLKIDFSLDEQDINGMEQFLDLLDKYEEQINPIFCYAFHDKSVKNINDLKSVLNLCSMYYQLNTPDPIKGIRVKLTQNEWRGVIKILSNLKNYSDLSSAFNYLDVKKIVELHNLLENLGIECPDKMIFEYFDNINNVYDLQRLREKSQEIDEIIDGAKSLALCKDEEGEMKEYLQKVNGIKMKNQKMDEKLENLIKFINQKLSLCEGIIKDKHLDGMKKGIELRLFDEIIREMAISNIKYAKDLLDTIKKIPNCNTNFIDYSEEEKYDNMQLSNLLDKQLNLLSNTDKIVDECIKNLSNDGIELELKEENLPIVEAIAKLSKVKELRFILHVKVGTNDQSGQANNTK